MRVTEVCNTALRQHHVRRFFFAGLALMLSMSLTVPVWAVVFPNAAPITINDAATVGTANPYSSDVTVSGLSGNITSVTVGLHNFNHTFPDDLDIMLVAPGGQNLVLMSDAAGDRDITNATLIFDDAAAATLSDGGPGGSGTFKPSQFTAGDTYPAPAPAPSVNTTFAAAFNGTAPNGTWNLYVVDDTGIDQGVIGNGWSLNLTTDSGPGVTVANSAPIFINDRFAKATPYASTINATGLTGAITDVNVTFTNINHLNPDDLDILLVSPSGKSIVLMSDSGGTTDLVGVNITLDDAAGTQLSDAGPTVSGTFRPANFGSGDNLSDVLPFYGNAGSAGPTTLASAFNGTDGNGIWKLYVIDDATSSTGNINGGWSLDITAGGSFNAKRFTNADFDYDGKTDTALFRPSDGNWYLRDSSNYRNRLQLNWGAATDIAVPGDYDGDHKTDIAVYRASEGNWYIIRSSTGVPLVVNWGGGSDVPVAGDYNADGTTDIAVWRPSEGNWYVRGQGVVGWGASTDIPIPGGDFNGDGNADYAVYRPSEGNWYIKNGNVAGSSVTSWGTTGDKLVPGDYDGDGRTDLAVWRPAESTWYIINSSTSTVTVRSWGLSTDIPVPGDYDGDSRSDIAVFRPTDGNWYITNSGTTPVALRIDNAGQMNDKPVASAYVPLQP